MFNKLNQYLQIITKIFTYHPPERKIINSNLKNSLTLLDKVNLLTESNRTQVAAFDFKYHLYLTLIELYKANLLVQIHFDALFHVLRNDYTGQMVAKLPAALQYFNNEYLLNPDYFNLLLSNANNADRLASGLVTLHKASILTDNNKQFVIAHADQADRLATILTELTEKKLLEPSVQAMIMKNPKKAIELINVFFSLPQILSHIDNLKKMVQCAPFLKELKLQLIQYPPITQQQFDLLLMKLKNVNNYRSRVLHSVE